MKRDSRCKECKREIKRGEHEPKCQCICHFGEPDRQDLVDSLIFWVGYFRISIYNNYPFWG